MKRLFVLLLTFVFFNSSFAQTASVYAVESEYTTAFGYRYFFDKINSQTGDITQLAQLPIAGFYIGNAFINHQGNFVFTGIDTVPTSQYVYKIYEVDTLGNVVNALPVTNATGNGPDLLWLFQSRKCPVYYGIKWYGNDTRELVRIDPATGNDTVLAEISVPYHNSQATGAIDDNDNVFFLESNGLTQNKILFKANPANGTIVATDSIPGTQHLYNMFYDCEQNNMHAFHTPDGVFGTMGSEWVTIDAAGTIDYTGTLIGTSGNFYSAGFTTLANGTYYQKYSMNNALVFDPASVSGTSYSPPVVALEGGDHKLFAAPPLSCNYTYNCAHGTAVNTLEEMRWSLHPNPADGVALLSVSNALVGTRIRLTDAVGRLLIEKTIDATLVHIDTDALPNGVYFLHEESASGAALKLVVQRQR